ncbi:hypothetical protein Vadar_018789 [Vaccinium darrowii]|uniref:Uncharacterized protein n=1 Tax=Vaccinium darrowii TaxID=229202 RepID=A0ACB7YFL2_9ERIC|nr:hypothetical protein Vadar_018789 [Vaccinium darrowii]
MFLTRSVLIFHYKSMIDLVSSGLIYLLSVNLSSSCFWYGLVSCSLGRYLQKSLAMVATLCGPGREILSWKLSPLEGFLTANEKYVTVFYHRGCCTTGICRFGKSACDFPLSCGYEFHLSSAYHKGIYHIWRFAGIRDFFKISNGPKYDGKYLHQLIKGILGDTKLHRCLTNLVIPAFDIKKLQPTVFSTFQVPV